LIVGLLPERWRFAIGEVEVGCDSKLGVWVQHPGALLSEPARRVEKSRRTWAYEKFLQNKKWNRCSEMVLKARNFTPATHSAPHSPQRIFYIDP
jgi:hypothetical protein